MTVKIPLVLAVCLFNFANGAAHDYYTPSVQILNGTYTGIHSPYYNQDFYLGIPYAQPPVGALRYRVPQSLNTSWSEARNATEYSPFCVGYGSATRGYNDYVSEDCLTLNIVRPVGVGESLPVALGGFIQGGGGDARYNLSFSVQQAVLAGKPHIGVSLNYRLGAWGFLYGNEIQKDGSANLGFRDQRLALHWIQENIAAFGGDPAKVTIWGQSAGAGSVGAQLVAYNGRDDGLFRGAIAESGAPLRFSKYPSADDFQPVYNSIVDQTGCASSNDTLRCLRGLTYAKLNSVLNSTTITAASWGPVIDGDFFQDRAGAQLQDGRFVKVPLIIGANDDEGTSFGPKGINNDTAFLSVLNSDNVSNASIPIVAILYPDIPSIGIPGTFEGRPDTTQGLQYKRSSAYIGDSRMHIPRRITSAAWAAANITSYSYRFNVLVNGINSAGGSNHFEEVSFVFYNLDGVGYPPAGYQPPFQGKPKSYRELAKVMTLRWSSFVADLDPNTIDVDAVPWPKYTLDNPCNFYFTANQTSYVEPDTYRAEAIEYLSGIAAAAHVNELQYAWGKEKGVE
ncbi:triacylglycerol lipase [Cadophora sp. DSE1049]|nr:triacylglycerol lipase [Cadophora sp. DSE1049]